jgi:AraC-like DNA-binding protein
MSSWPDILDTRDPDVAFRHLTGCYVGVDNYDVVGKTGDFRLNRRKMELGRLVMVRGKLRTGYRLRALPGMHLVAMIPESGGLAMTAGRRVAESGRQRNGIVSPRDRFSVEYHGASGYTLLVGHDQVVRRLEELDEHATVAAVNGAIPLSLDLNSPVGVRFRATLNFVWAQLAGSGAVRPPALLVAALEEVLLNGFMLLLSPDGRSRSDDAVADPGRRVILEACEIMRARIEEPVRIGEIASALGISARHLQAGFRRHFGKTPQTFLTDCRLDLARRKLQERLPGQSVTAAALECGFSNLGEFAGRYRKRFGENPSETLKRAR